MNNNNLLNITELFVDLEEQFSQQNATTTTTQSATTKPKQNNTKDIKMKIISFLDRKRSQNMNIMFVQFGKRSFSEIVDNIINFDTDSLKLFQISSLLDYIHQIEEISAINKCVNSGDDINLLGKAEKFILEISKVSKLKQRLDCIQIKCSFHENIANINEDIQLITITPKQ